MKNFIRFSLLLFIFLSAAICAAAQPSTQTTAFNYQGKLTDGGNPANGSYQMQFSLFDAVSGGTQIGTTISDIPVTVSQGVFAVKLDFGANAFGGANRWLEIAVRRNAGESYVTLSPREQIASSPYAVRTISAAMADDSQRLGGVAASEYLTNSSVGNSFIRNGTTLQTANLNISGNGFFGGRLGVGTTNPIVKLHVLDSGIVETSTGSTNERSIFSLNSTIGGANRVWTLENGLFGTAGLFGIFDRTASQARLVINTNGNVGIGTTNPVASKFEVQDTSVGTAIFGNTTTAGSGVFGSSQNGSGFGVYAQNVSGGFALYAEGKVGQNAAALGLPKAMILINTNNLIVRCYNGVTGALANNGGQNACGFAVALTNGLVRIDFGFPVNNSFFALVIRGSGNTASGIYTSNETAILTANQIGVDRTNIATGFSVIVY